MLDFRYNTYRGVKMSKKKKRKVSLAAKIMGILMLLLMVGSTVVGILAYVIK